MKLACSQDIGVILFFSMHLEVLIFSLSGMIFFFLCVSEVSMLFIFIPVPSKENKGRKNCLNWQCDGNLFDLLMFANCRARQSLQFGHINSLSIYGKVLQQLCDIHNYFVSILVNTMSFHRLGTIMDCDKQQLACVFCSLIYPLKS